MSEDLTKFLLQNSKNEDLQAINITLGHLVEMQSDFMDELMSKVDNITSRLDDIEQKLKPQSSLPTVYGPVKIEPTPIPPPPPLTKLVPPSVSKPNSYNLKGEIMKELKELFGKRGTEEDD